jgi:ABC-type proline/glycine betaine transport system ATPase subunit
MVAHRLDTAVTYCDSILVLDKGTRAQYDSPLALLLENETDESVTKEDSIFANMVQALTDRQQDKIVQTCKDKRFKRNKTIKNTDSEAAYDSTS